MIDTDKHKNVEFQLRRIGAAATRPQVRDLMKISKDVTKFGRHSGNDFYLDSAKLDCFISRWHSEIHRVLQHGKIHFVLRDYSLNGTYVNNHRVLGNHVLKPGEVICFGHTNGKNLKPGEYAPQTDSEFEFTFEECPEDNAELEQAIEKHHSRVNHPIVDSTTDIHSPSSPIMTPLESVATLPHSQDTPLTGTMTDNISRRPINTVSPTSRVVDKDRSSPILKDISNKNASTVGLVPLDQFVQTATGNRPTAPCNINVQVTQDRVFPNSVIQQASAPTQQVIIQPSIASREERIETVISSASSPAEPTPASVSHPSRKKRKTSESSSASGGKRKPKPKGRGMKHTKRRSSIQNDEEDDSDDDHTWHYDGDKCDAFDCKRPKSKTVSWVQCDDCDDWYHTACAGCRYDNVKRTNAEFHCGCV